MARLLLVVAAALILCSAAAAATINDLPGLGYTVTVANPGPDGQNCPTYYVSGHGAQAYVNCNSQRDIDKLADPTTICDADWQANHPDQLSAYKSIAGKGWGLSGNECSDVFTVTNPNDNTTAYSGSGSGLPGFDQAHGAPPAAPVGSPSPSTPNSGPTFCLPVCPNPGDTRGGGGVLIPGGGVLVPASATAPAQPLTAISAVPPITDPTVAPVAAAILFPDRSTGYLARAGYGSDGALAP